jgi:hypothetical protein
MRPDLDAPEAFALGTRNLGPSYNIQLLRFDADSRFGIHTSNASGWRTFIVVAGR